MGERVNQGWKGEGEGSVSMDAERSKKQGRGGEVR